MPDSCRLSYVNGPGGFWRRQHGGLSYPCVRHLVVQTEQGIKREVEEARSWIACTHHGKAYVLRLVQTCSRGSNTHECARPGIIGAEHRNSAMGWQICILSEASCVSRAVFKGDQQRLFSTGVSRFELASSALRWERAPYKFPLVLSICKVSHFAYNN